MLPTISALIFFSVQMKYSTSFTGCWMRLQVMVFFRSKSTSMLKSLAIAMPLTNSAIEKFVTDTSIF